MPDNYNIIMQELVRRSNEETRRLRTIEQRLDTMEDKLNTLGENTTDRGKGMNKRFADMEVSNKTLNEELMTLKSNVERLTKQMSKFAQRRDLKEIERMLDLLNPANKLEIPEEIHVKG